MPGRKRTPTVLKLLRGNPGKRPINHDEPVIEGDLPAPPDWMTPLQQDIWTKAQADAPKNLLKSLDYSVFTAWVVACAAHQEATIKVAETGLVVKGKTGAPQKNPFLAIADRQALIMIRTAAEMGFTPVSRSKVKVKQELPKDGSFAEFASA